MPSRRTWLRLLAYLVLLLLLLGATSYLSLNRALERAQVSHLDWQGLGISTQGIQLEQLRLEHPAATVQLQHLQLPWRGFSLAPPFWQQIVLAAMIGRRSIVCR